MGTGTTALFQLSVGIPVNTAKTPRVFPPGFFRACAYSAFRSLLQFEKTLQESSRCKQAESPARKTPGENRRQVKRPKGKLGRGVTGLRSKRLGRVVVRACSFTCSPLYGGVAFEEIWSSSMRVQDDCAVCLALVSNRRVPCTCRKKLPTCQKIGSFHQIEEPNKEGKRARLMMHPADLGIRFCANGERTAKRAQALSA